MDMARRSMALSSLLVILFVAVPAISYRAPPKRCSTLNKMDNRIIDISSSIKCGAQVVAGALTVSGAACASKCCHMDKCHLAVFNKETVSNTGHNCYLVNCGNNLANCKLEPHHSFVSISVLVGGSRGKAADSDGRENFHVTHARPGTGSVTTITPTSSSHSTSSVSSSSVANGHKSSTTSTAIVSVPTQGDRTEDGNENENNSDGTEDENEKDNNSDRTKPKTDDREHESENSSNGHSKTGDRSGTDSKGDQHTSNKTATSSPSPQLNTSTAGAQDHTSPDRHTIHTKNGCSGSQCIGTGFIILGVVGGIVALVMALVLLVVAKRIVKSRQRKRFQNVDYLINGMYS